MARFNKNDHYKNGNFGHKWPAMTSFNPKIIPMLSWDIIVHESGRL